MKHPRRRRVIECNTSHARKSIPNIVLYELIVESFCQLEKLLLGLIGSKNYHSYN